MKAWAVVTDETMFLIAAETRGLAILLVAGILDMTFHEMLLESRVRRIPFLDDEARKYSGVAWLDDERFHLEAGGYLECRVCQRDITAGDGYYRYEYADGYGEEWVDPAYETWLNGRRQYVCSSCMKTRMDARLVEPKIERR